jgi:hypothetical protein
MMKKQDNNQIAQTINQMKGNDIMNNARTIVKRVINSKRHTVGFVLSGNLRVSRSEAVRMAKASKIRGVRVISGSQGTYLQSITDRNLYDLPTVVS